MRLEIHQHGKELLFVRLLCERNFEFLGTLNSFEPGNLIGMSSILMSFSIFISLNSSSSSFPTTKGFLTSLNFFKSQIVFISSRRVLSSNL